MKTNKYVLISICRGYSFYGKISSISKEDVTQYMVIHPDGNLDFSSSLISLQCFVIDLLLVNNSIDSYAIIEQTDEATAKVLLYRGNTLLVESDTWLEPALELFGHLETPILQDITAQVYKYVEASDDQK